MRESALRPPRWAPLVLATALVLTACGDGATPEPAAQPLQELTTVPTTGPAPTVTEQPPDEAPSGQTEPAAATLDVLVQSEGGGPAPEDDAVGLLQARLERLGEQGTVMPKGNGEVAVALSQKPPVDVLSALSSQPRMRVRPVITDQPIILTDTGSGPSPTALVHDGYSGKVEVGADVVKAFIELTCAGPADPDFGSVSPAEPQVACDEDGTTKYLLEPAAPLGAAELRQTTSEQVPGTWQLEASLDTSGTLNLGDLTTYLFTLDHPGRMAFVEDGTVIHAPMVHSPITGGVLTMDNLDEETAQALTRWFRFNSDPWYFQVQGKSD